MRRQFILGMIAAPILFIIYLGAKNLFKPSAEFSEEDKKDYLVEINFTDEHKEKIVPTIGFQVGEKDGLKEMHLQDLKGKPSIIHFWATWCKPCAFEMPEFSKFVKENSKKYNILTISGDMGDKVEDAQATVTKFIKEKGYTHLKVAYDNKAELARAWKLAGYPTTILLDKEGKEIGRFNGVLLWNDPQFIMVFRSLLQ